MKAVYTEQKIILSRFLQREVTIDFFFPDSGVISEETNLLLINDGQNLTELNLASILGDLYADNFIEPLLCIGIHSGADRKMEYGVASRADYLGRGAKAGLYTSFIIQELLPFVLSEFSVSSFKTKAFAGFSLGGLSALDIVWNYPSVFQKAGVFSGSFWWRSVDQSSAEYDDDKHRIMHQQIRNGMYKQGLQFFFQCGEMDEAVDRNNNGIIDSIDDTLDMIKELEKKGYERPGDMYYLEIAEGKHDIATWSLAMPSFLRWGWGR